MISQPGLLAPTFKSQLFQKNVTQSQSIKALTCDKIQEVIKHALGFSNKVFMLIEITKPTIDASG